MKVIVVGAGAAGMMAAIKAAENNEVIILEKNKIPGRKIFITGKGRCNVTNACDISDYFNNIPRNPEFLYSALYTFTNSDLQEFFKSKGVKLKTERGNRVFPESDKSNDIIKALVSELARKNVEVIYETVVTGIKTQENKVVALNTSKGQFTADHFILTTGGASYPLTGSDGKMLEYLNRIGIKTNTFIPSLVPLTVLDEDIKELTGISLKNVTFSLNSGKKKLYSELGEMLFTHDGISGPIVLSASAHRETDRKMNGYIDLKPGLDEKQLDLRILRDFDKYKNKDIRNGLNDLLIQRLIPFILKRAGIVETKKVNEITKEERRRLVETIKNLEFTIKGARSMSEAIISRGGVATTEIDPSTMKLKKFTNLSVAGEMIDVDALTGGFNLQIAFSTGYLAGGNI
ncbi:MAG: NAD(P)/FAD-dependent oxidoreductase [Clostridiaceae bacterium]